MTRLERLAALLAEHQASVDDFDEGEEEDLRPYFAGAELARWCCVTVNYSSHGHAKFFFLPTFEDRDAATARAVEHAQDDIFEELPVAVVDLDTGLVFRPDFGALAWSERAS